MKVGVGHKLVNDDFGYTIINKLRLEIINSAIQIVEVNLVCLHVSELTEADQLVLSAVLIRALRSFSASRGWYRLKFSRGREH